MEGDRDFLPDGEADSCVSLASLFLLVFSLRESWVGDGVAMRGVERILRRVATFTGGE